MIIDPIEINAEDIPKQANYDGSDPYIHKAFVRGILNDIDICLQYYGGVEEVRKAIKKYLDHERTTVP